MIKLSTDGSGVEVTIQGCPYCDQAETRNLRYHNSRWTIDPDMDTGRRSFRVHYCPCCGKILPLLGGWEVKHPLSSPAINCLTEWVYSHQADIEDNMNDFGDLKTVLEEIRKGR